MSVKFNPIKRFSILSKYPQPKIENDLKLQAILIYSLARIEDLLRLEQTSAGEYIFENKEEINSVYSFLIHLKNELEKQIPSFIEIEKSILTLKAKNNPTAVEAMAFNEYIPVVRFYNLIIKECEKVFTKETLWIPDLVAISLINHWLIDLSKQTITYSFLNNYDFQSILDRYNNIALKSNHTKYKKCINEMYDISKNIVIALDTHKYGLNQSKNQKKRGKQNANTKTNRNY